MTSKFKLTRQPVSHISLSRNLEKAFRPSPRGQALGVEFDLRTFTWYVPQKKINDMSQTLDEMVDKFCPARPIAFTVNVFERAMGILENFAQMSKIGRTLLLVAKAEMSYHLERFHQQNHLKPARQEQYCVLSEYARKNILQFRALLVISPEFHLPLEDPSAKLRRAGGAHIVLYTDASGKPKERTDPAYTPTCLGSFWPAKGANKTSRALAFVMPYSFLRGPTISKGKGGQRFVMDQTVLLELLPAFATILQFPDLFRHRVVTVFSDNQVTVDLFMNNTATKAYTAYFLEAFQFMLMALDIKLVMRWKRRRSTYPMAMSDDCTHAQFAHAMPGTSCQILQLPPPLFKVIHGTVSYHSHLLDTLRDEVRVYLEGLFPDLVFPCL